MVGARKSTLFRLASVLSCILCASINDMLSEGRASREEGPVQDECVAVEDKKSGEEGRLKVGKEDVRLHPSTST